MQMKTFSFLFWIRLDQEVVRIKALPNKPVSMPVTTRRYFYFFACLFIFLHILFLSIHINSSCGICVLTMNADQLIIVLEMW